jgi:hypothetical protein
MKIMKIVTLLFNLNFSCDSFYFSLNKYYFGKDCKKVEMTPF